MDEPTPEPSAEAESPAPRRSADFRDLDDIDFGAPASAPGAADAGATETGAAETPAPVSAESGAAAQSRPSGGALAGIGLGGRRGRAIIAVIGLLLVAAVIFGGSRLLLGSGAPAASPASSQTSAVAGSPGASGSAASGAPALTTSPLAPATVTPRPTATNDLPAQTAPTAQITFNSLVIPTSGNREPVTFAFVGDGPGLVSVSVVASAPTDSTKVCLSGDGGTPVCQSGATPTASFYGQSSQSKWTATVVSATANSPTIDVEITWPSNKGSISVAHAPFEGAPNPDSLRSLTATIKARAKGTIDLNASWAPAALTVSLTVLRLTASGSAEVDRASYNAAQAVPAHSTAVKAGSSYQIALMNLSQAKTPPDLTATIAFP